MVVRPVCLFLGGFSFPNHARRVFDTEQNAHQYRRNRLCTDSMAPCVQTSARQTPFRSCSIQFAACLIVACSCKASLSVCQPLLLGARPQMYFKAVVNVEHILSLEYIAAMAKPSRLRLACDSSSGCRSSENASSHEAELPNSTK